MNIRNIKNRADQLLVSSKDMIIRICIIMALVQLIPTLFSGSNNAFISMISFGLSIAFVAFHHGYVVTSLKVVRNNAESLKDEDAFVGFTRFKDLFPTYLVAILVMFGLAIALVIILTVIFAFVFGIITPNVSTLVLNSVLAQNNPYLLIQYLIEIAPSLIFVFLFMCIVLIVASFFIEVVTFAMPYLLEQYNMRTGTALKESFSFIKGHMIDYIKLELSFIGWAILMMLVQGVLAEILSFIPVLGLLIASGISSVIAVYLYYPKYILSKAIFFEEIAYYRYDHVSQQEEMNYE